MLDLASEWNRLTVWSVVTMCAVEGCSNITMNQDLSIVIFSSAKHLLLTVLFMPGVFVLTQISPLGSVDLFCLANFLLIYSSQGPYMYQ